MTRPTTDSDIALTDAPTADLPSDLTAAPAFDPAAPAVLHPASPRRSPDASASTDTGTDTGTGTGTSTGTGVRRDDHALGDAPVDGSVDGSAEGSSDVDAHVDVDVDADVIVVGAGFAGIAAARDLTRSGLSVLILEARDRIGGRTWTKASPLGLDLELGGAFVHWQQPHVWSEIVAHGLQLRPVPALQEAYWMGPNGVRSGAPEATYALMAPTMEALAAAAQLSFPTPHTPFPLTEAAQVADTVSIPDLLTGLDLTEEQLLFARSFLAIAFSGSPDASVGAGAVITAA